MKYSKIRKVKSPTRGTENSAGIDFYVPDEWNGGNTYILEPGERILIPSGIKASVPEGYALIAFNKSGIATKTGMIVGACVVDEDYQGEIHLSLINTNSRGGHWTGSGSMTPSGRVSINPGEKILQFVLIPVIYDMPVEVELKDLYEERSHRADGGFGSTGIK